MWLFLLCMDYLSILLVVLLLCQSYFSYRERRELTDRLMAKDLNDFKANESAEKNNYDEEEDEDLVSVEEARDEIADGQ